MRQKLKEKISEALTSVLPITAIVLLLSFTLAPMPIGTLMLAAICFLIGFVVTIAEPDLQVLAQQVPAVPNLVLILTVAAGVGAFLLMSMLRSQFNLPLHLTLIVLYIAVFVLSVFVPNEFLAVAFDSGGVTTGPITVPFIMSLCVGMAASKGSGEDNFGMVAMCSVGPTLAVMVLGLCYHSTEVAYTPFSIPQVATSQDAGRLSRSCPSSSSGARLLKSWWASAIPT